MRTLFVILIIALFPLLFTGCSKEDNTVYPTFTEDELRWIYFTGDNFKLEDTDLYYKVNDTGTTYVHVQSGYGNKDNPVHIEGGGSLRVHTGYEISFITVAGVSIVKYPVNNFNVEYISIINNINSWHLHPNDSLKDTALVNGKFYTDVYKFDSISPDTNGLSSVFFKKSYGFLKVEFNDGNKITLIP